MSGFISYSLADWFKLGYFYQEPVLKYMWTILIILILSPYLFIPWIMSFFLKRNKIHPAVLTYIFTIILVTAYTFFLQILPTFSSVEEGGYNCVPPIIIIIVPLLPISLVAQAIFNINLKRPKGWLTRTYRYKATSLIVNYTEGIFFNIFYSAN